MIKTPRFAPSVSLMRATCAAVIWSFLRGLSSNSSVKKQWTQRMSKTEVMRVFRRIGANGRPVAIRAYRFRISLWWKSMQLEASSIAGLLVAGDRLGFWSVVALFGMPGDLSQILRRIHFNRDFSVASIELGIRGCVADRVMVPQIVSDVRHKLLHLVDILRKERLAAGDVREFLEVILRFF